MWEDELGKYGLCIKYSDGSFRPFVDVMYDASMLCSRMQNWRKREKFFRLLFGDKKYSLMEKRFGKKKKKLFSWMSFRF